MMERDDLVVDGMTGPAHIAVALMLAEGRVLLVHRTPEREHHPDAWSFPGGHVEPGEAPSVAVVREVREELGVEIDGAKPVSMRVNAPGVVMHAFVVTSWSGVPLNLAPDEHDDLTWFESHELSDVMLAHPESLDTIIAVMAASQR